MQSMIVETDMANYVGSSYGWATTRDWAKFGLLLLHKGNWNGEQLFDELGQVRCNSYQYI
jgi:CubicO group peptidase (beta-lactamase class C family)